MTPEQRHAHLRAESDARRAEAEAAMPPMPEPPPMMAAPGEPTMPSAEEARARHEALKAMDPEERQAQLRAEREQRRAEAEAAAPPMPEPPPLMAAPGEPAMPSAEDARDRHEALKAMSPEERQAQLRAESEQRWAEAAAAAPPMPGAPRR
jgi:hypothetical protein